MTRVPFATAATVLNVLAVLSGLVAAGRVGAEHPQRAASVAATGPQKLKTGFVEPAETVDATVIPLILSSHGIAVCGQDMCEEHVSLANLVREFNAENKTLERGLDQPPLTEDEVVATIRRTEWKPDERNPSEREFAAFKRVAETRQVPKTSYFTVWTNEDRSTFVVNHIWSIELALPSVDGDGFDRFAIRHTPLREEKIDPKSVAWGQPDADGLSLGAYLSPRKDTYALAERVRLLLFVRNEGKKVVETMWGNTTHPMPDDFHVTDDKGAKVFVRKGKDRNWSEPWISGYMNGQLGPGDVHRLEVPYEISFGGDGSNKLVGRVIEARAGQTLQLQISLDNHIDGERNNGEPSRVSGPVTLAVAKADPQRR